MGKTHNFDRSAASDQSPATLEVVRSSRRFNILVAEDDAVNVKVTIQMISTLGHKLKVVNNGADAVQAIKDGGSFDVVLMDVRMPIMDGLEATRHIRKYEQTCHRASMNDLAPTQQGAIAAGSAPTDGGHRRRRRIPIIAMKADALADNIQECAKHGMENFIAKPVNLAELEKLLLDYVPTDNEI